MIDFFLVIVLAMLNETILAVAWVVMKAFNMIDPEYYGLAVFVLIMFVIIKKFFSTVQK